MLISLPQELIHMIMDYMIFTPNNEVWNVKIPVCKCLFVENLGIFCSDSNDRVILLDYNTGKIKSKYVRSTQFMTLESMANHTTHILFDNTRDRLVTSSKLDCCIWKSTDGWKTATEIKTINFDTYTDGRYDYINSVLLLQSGEVLIGGDGKNDMVECYNVHDGRLIRKIYCAMQDFNMECKNGNIILQYEDMSIGIFDEKTKQLKKRIYGYDNFITLQNNDIIVYDGRNIELFDNTYESKHKLKAYSTEEFIYRIYETDDTIIVAFNRNEYVDILDKHSLEIVQRLFTDRSDDTYIYNNIILIAGKKGRVDFRDSHGHFMGSFTFPKDTKFYNFKTKNQRFLICFGQEGITCYSE